MKIQVIIESDDGRVQDVEELACLKRGTLSQEELGLNLAEAKEILQGVQRSMTEHQVGDYTAERINPYPAVEPPKTSRTVDWERV